MDGSYEWSNELEELAKELRRLIGHGAKPHRMIGQDTLWRLGKAKYPEKWVRTRQVQLVLDIEAITNTYPPDWRDSYQEWFLVGSFNAAQADTDDVTERRDHIIDRLALEGNAQTLRRAESPEMDAMRDFAKRLYDRLTSLDD